MPISRWRCASPGTRRDRAAFGNGSAPRRLPATLHVLTPRELIVIQQDAVPGREGKGKFVYRTYHLPLGGIRQVEVRPGEDHVGQICAVSLADHTFRYPVEQAGQSVTAFYGLLGQQLLPVFPGKSAPDPLDE